MIRLLIKLITKFTGLLCVCILLAACSEKDDNNSTAAMPDSPENPALSDGRADSEKAVAAKQENARRPVIGETLAYAEVDDQLVKGHFVFPEDMVDTLPAILLIHEWSGLDDEIRVLAERFASEEFVVLAVDLFGGETAATRVDARQLILQVVEKPELAAQNIRQAYDWLLTTAGATQVGVVGYGFGGGWSLNAAMDMPTQIDAAVILYGQVSNNEESLAAVELPLLGFFGALDTSIPADRVKQFESILKKLDKTHEIKIYPNVKGGFASPRDRNYDPDLEQESWGRTLEFLHQYLSEAEDDSA